MLRSHRRYGNGHVRKPEQYEFEKGMTVFQALQAAGGAAEYGAINRAGLFRNGKAQNIGLTQPEGNDFGHFGSRKEPLRSLIPRCGNLPPVFRSGATIAPARLCFRKSRLVRMPEPIRFPMSTFGCRWVIRALEALIIRKGANSHPRAFFFMERPWVHPPGSCNGRCRSGSSRGCP